MLGAIRGEVRFKESLSFHTALRVGGPADVFVLPQDLNDVRRALDFVDREQLPLSILGEGNNVLASDRGVRGLVLKLDGRLRRTEFQDEDGLIGAGASLQEVLREAGERGLGGLECLTGISSTIGGALALNVGGPDGRIGDSVLAVYYMYADGTVEEVKPDADTGMPACPQNAVILGCRLRFQRRPVTEIQDDMKRHLKRRRSLQPSSLAAAPIWQDPPDRPAAELIATARLRAKRVNAAEICAKHPNFILNQGGATATDVVALMALTRDAVRARTGITLEPYIRMIGLDLDDVRPQAVFDCSGPGGDRRPRTAHRAVRERRDAAVVPAESVR